MDVAACLPTSVWILRRGALVIALCAATAASIVSAAEIRLRATASSAGPIVRLGEVSDIASNDPQEAAALGDVVLGPAPAPGGAARFELASIRSQLAARGVNLSRTSLTGSAQVVVTTAGHGIVPVAAINVVRPVDERAALQQRQRAEKLVTDAIRSWLDRNVRGLGRYTIAARLEPDEVAAVLAGAANGYEVSGGAAPWDQPQRFTLRTLDRTRAIREIAVECRLAPWPYVLGMRQMVPKGQILQAADLVWRQADKLEGAFLRPEELIGSETTRALRQDEIVRKDDVRSVPLVRSNDLVTVVARSGGIAVKRPMKARSDGSLGETVTLVTLDGKQSLIARVTGFHEAEALGNEVVANGK